MKEYVHGGRPGLPAALLLAAAFFAAAAIAAPEEAAAVGAGERLYGAPAGVPESVPAGAVPAEVTRVVDGDTVIVRFFRPPAGMDAEERVRLIGIDAPESVRPGTPVQRFSEEASAYARLRLPGRRVFLSFDRELRDRYGRVLAYLHLEDGVFFNARMIWDGYAYAYTRYPFRYLKEFRELERRARREKRGLWATAAGGESYDAEEPASASRRR